MLAAMRPGREKPLPNPVTHRIAIAQIAMHWTTRENMDSIARALRVAHARGEPRTDPPAYVRNIQRLAQATGAYVVQTNWPNALNRPEESVDGGASNVAAPDGELLLRLPAQAAGVGVFDLGARTCEWHPQ